jgi:hypothetical protein
MLTEHKKLASRLNLSDFNLIMYGQGGSFPAKCYVPGRSLDAADLVAVLCDDRQTQGSTKQKESSPLYFIVGPAKNYCLLSSNLNLLQSTDMIVSSAFTSRNVRGLNNRLFL